MLILSRGDVMDLLTLDTCIDAVERAFRLHAWQRTFGPRVLGLPTEDGGFHIKVAGLQGDRSYFAAPMVGSGAVLGIVRRRPVAALGI